MTIAKISLHCILKDPQIWQTLTTEIKNSELLGIFKSNKKKFRKTNCQCKMCKIYVRNLGYVDG